MELSFGEARSGIGGGICQLSNLIHWMALHSPLRAVERPTTASTRFPTRDGSCRSARARRIFYNFIDLVLHNPTADTFQLRFHIAAHQLEGELLCSAPRPVRYHVYERAQRFVRDGEAVLRLNEIWRDIRERARPAPCWPASACTATGCAEVSAGRGPPVPRLTSAARFSTVPRPQAVGDLLKRPDDFFSTETGVP